MFKDAGSWVLGGVVLLWAQAAMASPVFDVMSAPPRHTLSLEPGFQGMPASLEVATVGDSCLMAVLTAGGTSFATGELPEHGHSPAMPDITGLLPKLSGSGGPEFLTIPRLRPLPGVGQQGPHVDSPYLPPVSMPLPSAGGLAFAGLLAAGMVRRRRMS